MTVVLYKTLDTTRLSNTLATADPDLQFPIDANSTYLVRGQLWFRGSTPGDLRNGFWSGDASIVYASGQSIAWFGAQTDATITKLPGSCTMAAWDAVHLSTNYTRSYSMLSGANRLPMQFVYMFKTGPISGDFSVTWAQYASDAVNPAKLLAGSLIQYEKLP